MLKQDLQCYTSHYVGQHPHRYIAYDLTLSLNRELRDKLSADGFDTLHSTNNLNIVYEHQIVAFYNCGGIHAMRRGFKADKGVVSVHHINGMTFDNRPENLVYLQDDLHNAITQSQRWIYKGLKVWDKVTAKKLQDLPSIWNRQGREVKNILSFVLKMLMQTLINTARVNRLEVKAKQIGNWLRKLKKNLTKGFNLPDSLPEWMGGKLPSIYLT